MITVEFFNYTDAQWNAIKAVIRDELGRDADQIEQRITPVTRYGIGGMLPLRECIENAATQYRLRSDVNSRTVPRDELETLRDDAANIRDRIISAVGVKVVTKDHPLAHPLPLAGADGDMVMVTSHLFRKLARNLDRQIKLARSRRDSARKTAREQCWIALLDIWRDFLAASGAARRRRRDYQPRSDHGADVPKSTQVPLLTRHVTN